MHHAYSTIRIISLGGLVLLNAALTNPALAQDADTPSAVVTPPTSNTTRPAPDDAEAVGKLMDDLASPAVDSAKTPPIESTPIADTNSRTPDEAKATSQSIENPAAPAAGSPKPSESIAPETASPAPAQTESSPPTAIVAVSPPPVERRGGGTIEEVVVTATKRPELASNVAASVSVLSGEKLEAIGAQNFQDFATYVPGLSSASGGKGENQIAIRGITSGAQISSTVGVYVDETPIGSSSAFALGSYGLDFNVFDLSRLEVLSGPQGTLYGASTLGGLIKYVTAAPNIDAYEVMLQSDLSTKESGAPSHSVRGETNVPLIQDHLAVRASGYLEKDGGFIDNPNRGLKNIDGSDSRGARVSLLGKITPDLDIHLSFIDQGIDRTGRTTVDRSSVTHEPVQGEYDQSVLVNEPFKSNLLLYSGTISWDLDWAQLTAMSSWQNVSTSGTIDYTSTFGSELHTGNSIPFVALDSSTVKKGTHEIRVASPESDFFEWRVGAFFTNEDANNFLGITGHLANNNMLLGLIPVGAIGPDLTIPLLNEARQSTYQELAGFTDLTTHVTSKFDLLAGFRYSENRQAYTQQQTGVLGLLSTISSATGNTDRNGGASKVNVPTYMFGTRYHLDDSSMIYTRIASGYRPGGPNYIAPAPFPSGPSKFNPDTVWNYEVGTKSSFLDKRIALEFNVFYIDWKNIQLLANIDGNNTIENGSKATVRGSELTGQVSVIEGFTLGGNLSYSDAILAEDAPALDAKSGSRLPFSPRLSGALTADLNVPIGASILGSAGLSYRYVGNRPAGFDGSTQLPQYMMAAYQMVDLHFGAQTRLLNVSFFVKNLFNKAGEISADTSSLQNDPTGNVRVAIVQPRAIGLTLTLKWNSDE